MSELYWQDGRFDDALPLLEMLTRKEAERGTQVVRLTRLAQASLGAGLRDKARRAYRRALELDGKDLGALRGVLPLLVETGQFVDARQVSETLLCEHREALGPAELADLLATQGQAEMALSNVDAALVSLRQARELAPLHRLALAQLRRIEQLSAEDKLEVRQSLLRALLGMSGEPGTTDERIAVLTEIGDLYAAPLAKPQDAIASYREALALSPKAVTIQHKLLSLYTEQQLWSEAADLLQELAAAEPSEKRRARYKQTAGFITRDHLHEPRRALRLLWSSFDDDPTLLKSLESAETLAAQINDPKELLRALQRRIKVMGADNADTPKQRAERLRLWTEVARVCIQELGDLKTGMSAYEVTLNLEPTNIDRHRQMAAIYTSAGEDKLDKAIAEHHVVLKSNKGELSSYRALRELYGQTGQRERSLQVAAALQLLRQGEPEDAALVDELRSRPVTLARRPLTKELWRLLAHPEEDPRVASLLAVLWPALQRSHCRPWSEQPFERASRVEASAPQVYLKALRYAFEMTETPLPELFPRPQARELAEQAFLISIASDGKGPTTVCAELGPPLLDPSRPERETLYEVGRMAALLRPERAVRTVLSDEQELTQILEAALLLTQQEINQVTPPASAQTIELARNLRSALSPQQLEQLSRVGRTLLDSTVKPLALANSWLSASELTTVRVGLLLCGELETAALLLATDPPGLTLLSPKQRLLELLHFSVSEELASVRQFLGL
jgi:tetratricopeptide (TPR) repeat protein